MIWAAKINNGDQILKRPQTVILLTVFLFLPQLVSKAHKVETIKYPFDFFAIHDKSKAGNKPNGMFFLKGSKNGSQG